MFGSISIIGAKGIVQPKTEDAIIMDYFHGAFILEFVWKRFMGSWIWVWKTCG